MIKFENDCVGPCPQGCLGSSCPNRNVPYFYCDECGDGCDPGELYDYDSGTMLCKYCLLSKFETVAQVIDRNPNAYD